MPKRTGFSAVISVSVLGLAGVALIATAGTGPVTPAGERAELGGAAASGAVTLDSVLPARQHVHGYIELRGSGFGAYAPGVSQVSFTAGSTVIAGGTPYVWRDDYIRIRVPVGDFIDDAIVLIPKVPLAVAVTGANGTSGTRPFRVRVETSGTLSFVERTEIDNEHIDISTFLGDPPRNLARTKDADIGDANGDGYPDLIDNNSNGVLNSTHPVLRINNGGANFSSQDMEPLNANDAGDFATTVPQGGRYLGDGVIYDADFVDLDNDGLPDLVQAAARTPDHTIRILINNYLGVPGRFVEASEAWLGDGTFVGCPDDVSHADANGDGWVDIAVALRTAHGDCGGPNGTGAVLIYLNQAGASFSDPVTVLAPNMISSHDSVFLDADDDGDNDLFMVNEEGTVCQLFLNNGGTIPSFTLSQSLAYTAFSGEEGDFNGDGLQDLVMGRINTTSVFLNRRQSPGSFTEVVLSNAQFGMYDYEIGDIDSDGFPDIVGCAIVSDGTKAIQVWMNRGDGTFLNVTTGNSRNLLPDLGDYQRLSAELLDFDLDGDLDLYVTGADGQSVGYGFGRVPNQFYENLLATVCVGDVDESGTIDFDDLLLVLSSWGPCEGCPADVDGDDEVNFDDLLLVLSGWGPCK